MTPEFGEYLVELFAELGPVRVRRVFNLDGLYLGDTMFGLVLDDRIYLKADEQHRKAFEQEGSAPLKYIARNREPIVMSYWELPSRLYDEPENLVAWARAACAAAEASSGLRKRVRPGRRRIARQPIRRRSRS